MDLISCFCSFTLILVPTVICVPNTTFILSNESYPFWEYEGNEEVTDNEDFRRPRIRFGAHFDDMIINQKYTPFVAVWACSWICSGVAVAPTKIITTAHCVHGCDYIKVMGYNHGWKRPKKVVKRKLTWDCYKHKSGGICNIARLETDDRVFNQGEVKYPYECTGDPSKYPLNRRYGYVMGIGLTTGSGTVADVPDEPRAAYIQMTNPDNPCSYYLHWDQFCFGKQETHSICGGDEGGPVFLVGGYPQRPICLMGLTTYGGCSKDFSTYAVGIRADKWYAYL